MHQHPQGRGLTTKLAGLHDTDKRYLPETSRTLSELLRSNYYFATFQQLVPEHSTLVIVLSGSYYECTKRCAHLRKY